MEAEEARLRGNLGEVEYEGGNEEGRVEERDGEAKVKEDVDPIWAHPKGGEDGGANEKKEADGVKESELIDLSSLHAEEGELCRSGETEGTLLDLFITLGSTERLMPASPSASAGDDDGCVSDLAPSQVLRYCLQLLFSDGSGLGRCLASSSCSVLACWWWVPGA